MNHENQLQAYLTLDPARNRIRIHRQTIRLLKNPAYVPVSYTHLTLPTTSRV